jgi:hypothetical protein
MKNTVAFVFSLTAIMVVMTCKSSPKNENKESIESDTVKPVTSSVKNVEEKYEQVVQGDSLFFRMTDVTGTSTISEDGSQKMTGTFETLTCNGKPVDVETNDIISGWISTKGFGKIMISTGTWGSFTVFLKPSQKTAFKKLY